MRRLASVFSRRDKEKEPPRPDPRRATIALPSLVPAASTPASSSLPPTPILSSSSEQASSASSNGSASLSLQTPEDDPVLSRTPTKTKSFSAWLRTKSGTIKRTRSAAAVHEHWVEPLADSEWRPKPPAPVLRLPPPTSTRSQPPVLDVDIDSDEDATSPESDDDETGSLLHSAPALPPSIPPTSVAQSRKNLEILIQNSLAPSLVASPFAGLPGAPMYPRSSNSPRSLPARPTMQCVMHKTLLLRRLQHPEASTRTAQVLDRSISPFASRPPPTPVDPPSSLPWFHVRAPPTAMKITPSCPGLRSWASRPCFEERVAVWVPVNGVVTSRPVEGTSAAVAALEYSDALEAMIDVGAPPAQEEILPAAESQPATATAIVRTTQPLPSPSPLRNSALKPRMSQTTPANPDASVSPPLAPTTSRVRFVEDDKEDVIPVGYVLRLKKRREEKAKFLREEQERRAFEEERARQEEERMRRERERRRWEEEKQAWEKEKKAMEEERKLRIYAEEVAAARIRREHQRAGGGYVADNPTLTTSGSATSLRDERNSESGKYSRPWHDQHGPRRQASEPAVLQHPSTPSSFSSSPGSSRPPSIGRNSSRPPSVHSASEDSRQPNTSAGKRSSVASLSGKIPNFDRSSIYNSSLKPPVPPVPMYALDMPLLPPTPPFMLQQYPRPKSQDSRNSSPGGSSHSASPSRQRQPSNGSSERVNVQNQQQQYTRSPSSSRRGSNSSHQRPEMTQQRRDGDDSRRASLPPPKDSQHDRGGSQHHGSMRSHSSSSLAPGRPPLPPSSFLPHPPGPWTAPPLATSYSQQQLNPAAVGYGAWIPPPQSRRQTTIS